MQAIVDLSLSATDRRFALPAARTQSLLFRFGEDTFGGVLTDASNQEFKPGSDHIGASLELWAPDTAAIVVGMEFVVWYDGDVGRGVVMALAAHG